MILVRLVDLYWLVAPDLLGHGPRAVRLTVHWLDVAAVAGAGWLCGSSSSRGSSAPVPSFRWASRRWRSSWRLAAGVAMTERPVPSNPEVRFEKTDVDAGALLKAGFVIVMVTIATVFFLYWLYFVFVRQEASRQPPPPILKPAAGVLAPPPPLLQTGPALDLTAFREQEDRILGGYGWVDKEQGVVRIPIEEAMRLLVEPGGHSDALSRDRVLGRRRSDAPRRPILAAGRSPRPTAPDALRDIGFDQKLGESLPLDLTLRDESGRAVRLRDYFGGKPVVLNLVYFDCPMLCTVSLNGLASALEVVSFVPGREFELVTISFDSQEGPALAAAQEEGLPRPLERAGSGSGMALPDRRRLGPRGNREGGGLPLRLGRGDEAVRASRGARGADPRGEDRALPLRHRVRARRTCASPSWSRGKGRSRARSTSSSSTATSTTPSPDATAPPS